MMASTDYNDSPEMADDLNAASEPQAELQRQLEDVRNENLRVIAEMRNMQARAQRDVAERVRYAEADFARELLPVLDDLKRTLDAGAATEAVDLLHGVQVVHENLLKALRNRGIMEIAAEGAAFDPNVHEALLHQPHDDVPAGQVVQEVSRGYRLHERVLRPARVIVSSGPAKA